MDYSLLILVLLALVLANVSLAVALMTTVRIYAKAAVDSRHLYTVPDALTRASRRSRTDAITELTRLGVSKRAVGKVIGRASGESVLEQSIAGFASCGPLQQSTGEGKDRVQPCELLA